MHVINGEHPAAMQHGNNSGSRVYIDGFNRTQQVLHFHGLLILSSVLMLFHGIIVKCHSHNHHYHHRNHSRSRRHRHPHHNQHGYDEVKQIIILHYTETLFNYLKRFCTTVTRWLRNGYFSKVFYNIR